MNFSLSSQGHFFFGNTVKEKNASLVETNPI